MALAWQKTPLLLGSQSPRRAELLRALGLQFRQMKADLNEDYPATLKAAEIAEYLASAKADHLAGERKEQELLICSDTVVWNNNESLEKASNRSEALEMLKKLSGREHEVITGVCFIGPEGKRTFSERCSVRFKTLETEEMAYYVDHYKPYDKAGAYGIQEWIGLSAIEAIHGSYFTVMGLPTHLIVDYLKKRL